MKKQGQRSMKNAIKICVDLVRFGIERQNLVGLLENQSYQNMSIIKVGTLF